jgi:hypothetical protein
MSGWVPSCRLSSGLSSDERTGDQAKKTFLNEVVMLVPTRRIEEKIDLLWNGQKVTVTLLSADRGRGRIGIEAPLDVQVVRR